MKPVREFLAPGFRRALARCRLCWMVTLAVFISIFIIEGVILVPSYANYERDLLARLEQVGRAATISLFRLAPPQAGAEEILLAAEDLTAATPLKGGALYRPDGGLIGTFGEAPELVHGEAGTRFLRSTGGMRYEVLWRASEIGADYAVVGRLDSSWVGLELWHFVLRIAGLVALIATFVTAVTMMILGITVLVPVLELRHNLLAAATDPASSERFVMTETRDDELGDVLRSFNRMLGQVAKSIAGIKDRESKLAALNRSLEQRVAARTRELAEKSALLEATFDNMAEGLGVIDANLNIVAFNRRYLDLFDLPAKKFQPGQPFADILRYSAECGEYGEGDVDALVRERLGLTRDLDARTYEHRRPDGTVIEMRSNRMPGGGLVVTFADVTERKAAEAAMRVAKETAESANRAKSEFLANMSHELRTPLNAIIGFADIMMQELFGALGQPQYREYARDIKQSGTHLLEVINDILDLSKVEAGRLELHEDIVEVGSVVDRCIQLVTSRAREAGVRLRLEVGTVVPEVYADERKIRQILINLLSNAVKFTPRGGEVKVSTGIDGNGRFTLTVADTGIGIASEHIERALAPFGQVDSALNRRYDGTGLGLPLAKGLAALHGGSLDLRSSVGVGTVVTFILPPERVVRRRPSPVGS